MQNIELTAGLNDGTTSIDVATNVSMTEASQEPGVINAHARMLADRITRALGLPTLDDVREQLSTPSEGDVASDDVPPSLLDLIYMTGRPLTDLEAVDGGLVDVAKEATVQLADDLRAFVEDTEAYRVKVLRVVEMLQKEGRDELAESLSNRLANLDERLATLRLI